MENNNTIQDIIDARRERDRLRNERRCAQENLAGAELRRNMVRI